MITFDGEKRLIKLATGTTSIEAVEIYSAWKRWVMEDTNSRFLPAFADSVGGNSLGSGETLGAYYFLQNGWLIKPQEASHQLTVIGNMFPIPDTAAIVKETDGPFTVQVAFNRASLSSVTVIESRAALTPEQDASLELLRKFETNRTVVDKNAKTLSVYDDDGVTILHSFDLKDDNGSPSTDDLYERTPRV